ncbi:MAG: YfaZ family outer membrane protein [Gammaproteobacteria bacterium]
MKRIFVWLAFLLASSPLFAGEARLSLNGDAFRARYTHDFDDLEIKLSGGWLHNSDRGEVLDATVYLPGWVTKGKNPLRAGIGVRGVYTDADEIGDNGGAVGVGGFLNYTLPRFNRLFILAEVYFAPEVLSIGDMEKYEDYSIALGYNMMRSADIFVGARYVKGDYDSGSSLFDNGMNLGFRIKF